MDSLLLVLAAALSFVFGWNNSSFLIGNLRGSGSLSLAAAVGVSAVGLLAGAFLEGPKMTGSLVGSLTQSTTEGVLTATLLVSLAMTSGLTLLRLPVSFSMVMFGAFLGASASAALQVDLPRSLTIIGFWFVAPAATALVTYLIYGATTRFVSRFGLLTVDSLNRGGAVLSALTVSYALGANNLGLIYGASSMPGTGTQLQTMAMIAVVAVVGMLVLGRGALGGTIGDRMLALSPQGVFSAFVASSLLVWVGTQLALPVSIGQCLLGGMLGAAYTRNITVLNTRLVSETVSLWLVAPGAALALAYLIAPLA